LGVGGHGAPECDHPAIFRYQPGVCVPSGTGGRAQRAGVSESFAAGATCLSTPNGASVVWRYSSTSSTAGSLPRWPSPRPRPPLPPGPHVAIGAHRDVDEARPDLRQRLGGKSARREGAGTIRLADDVRLPHEGPQALDVIRAAKVQARGTLPVAGVDDEPLDA